MDQVINQEEVQVPSTPQPVGQSSQKVENNSVFPKVVFILLGVLIVLGSIAGIYYFFGTRITVTSKVISAKKPVVTVIPTNLSDAKRILADLESNLKVHCPIKEVANINWNYGSTQNVLFSNGEVLSPCAGDNTSPYITFNTNDNNAITEEALQPLQTAVDNFFISHGFSKDSSNTMRNTGESKTGIDIGYIKGHVKCREELAPHYADFADFQCIETSQDIDTTVIELGQVLNPSKSSNTQISTDTIDGNYAKGFISTTNPESLQYFIAEKISGKWQAVWSGIGGTIGCSVVKKFNIPDAVLPIIPNFNLPNGKEPTCVVNK